MNTISERQASLTAGIGYVLLFVAGIFANFFVLEGVVEASDATITAKNMIASEGLFRVGILAFLGIVVADTLVSWALFIVFRRANEDLSRLAAWFRLSYTILLGALLVSLVQAIGYAAAGQEQDALDSVQTFTNAWAIGLSIFGLHLITIGWIGLRSRALPSLLSALLVIAGSTYLFDAAARILLGNYSEYATLFTTIVAVPSVVAEGWFGVWLLTKGGKEQ